MVSNDVRLISNKLFSLRFPIFQLDSVSHYETAAALSNLAGPIVQ